MDSLSPLSLTCPQPTPIISALERKKLLMPLIHGTHRCMISVDKCPRCCVKDFVTLSCLIPQNHVKYIILWIPFLRWEIRNFLLSRSLYPLALAVPFPLVVLSKVPLQLRCPHGTVGKLKEFPPALSERPIPRHGISPPNRLHNLPVCLFLISRILNIIT